MTRFSWPSGQKRRKIITFDPPHTPARIPSRELPIFAPIASQKINQSGRMPVPTTNRRPVEQHQQFGSAVRPTLLSALPRSRCPVSPARALLAGAVLINPDKPADPAACQHKIRAPSADSVGQATASAKAIFSVCGSASSTSWAPCESPAKHASMLIPPSCTSCPPCGSEFLLHSEIRKSVTSGCCRPGSLPRRQNLQVKEPPMEQSSPVLRPEEPHLDAYERSPDV
jgi:hypothetical protein